jgi:hypothetical protein
MHFCHGAANLTAMDGLWLAQPRAIEKRNHCSGPACQLSQALAITAWDGQWTAQPVLRQMIHQSQKKRQISRSHALFIKRENVEAGGGLEQEVRVFDTFRNALAGQQSTNIIFGQE